MDRKGILLRVSREHVPLTGLPLLRMMICWSSCRLVPQRTNWFQDFLIHIVLLARSNVRSLTVAVSYLIPTLDILHYSTFMKEVCGLAPQNG
jgi:hypothetical protein